MTYQEKIQQMLNNALAELGGAKYMGDDIVFYVHKNEGEYRAKTQGTQREKGKFIINCILIDQASTPIALQDLNAFEKRQSLDIVVPVDLTCTDLENGIYTGGVDYAIAVIEQFTQDAIGTTSTITVGDEEYSFVLTVGKHFTGQEGYFSGIGKAVPVSVDIVWQVFDGVLGNNIEVFVSAHGADEYTKALVVDGQAVRSKTGETAQYSEDVVQVDGAGVYNEMKTTITQQGLTLKLQIPFKRTGVAKELAADLWKSNLEKIYDVRIYDSVNYIHTDDDTDNPLQLPMLADEITCPMTAGAFLSLTVRFVVAKV